MSSFSLETSTPMCTVSDFMLYYPCLEAEPGGLTPSRNAYTTVEPLDETRRWAELTRRVMPLDPLEPRRRRPVRERPFRAGRSVRTLVRLNSSIVYHISIRQDPSVYVLLYMLAPHSSLRQFPREPAGHKPFDSIHSYAYHSAAFTNSKHHTAITTLSSKR